MLVSSSVKVRIIRGKDLLAADPNGKSDPYCKVWMQGVSRKPDKTHVKKKTLNPEWDEKFVYPVNDPANDSLCIEVWDHDTIGKDDSLGGCKVGLLGLVTERVLVVPLSAKGHIEIGLTAIAFDSSGLAPDDRTAIQEGNVIDPTSAPTAQPPPRWEVRDPQKFYGKAKQSHKAGWIQLFLNKPYYLSGEMIMGRVDLNLNTPITAKEVKIKWKGFEKSYIENTRTESDGNSIRLVRDVFKEDRTFFDQTLVLAQVNGGTLAPGLWSWTFQYQLPPDLPSVFFVKRTEFDGDKIKGAVVYKVKVWVDMPGSDIKAKEKLIISELLTQRVMPFTDKKVKSFAFAKGKLEFSVDLGKDVFIPSEVIPVHVKVVNPTSRKVTHFKVRLVMHTKIKAKSFTKKFSQKVMDVRFPGTEKKSDFEGVLTVQLPSNLYPSTNGKLCTCWYELFVEADFPMAFGLDISPKVVIALLPAPDVTYTLYNDYGGWDKY